MGRWKRLGVVMALGALVCIMCTGGGCFGPIEESSVRTSSPVAATGSKSTTPDTSSAPATPTGTPVKVLEVGNVYGIKAGAKAPRFTLKKRATLVQLLTYHYIAGGGPAPGTIGLKASNGTMIGPFQANGQDAQGGVKNGFWVANTNTVLEPGVYTVVDSSPRTWSTNSRAKGLGFTTVSVINDK